MGYAAVGKRDTGRAASLGSVRSMVSPSGREARAIILVFEQWVTKLRSSWGSDGKRSCFT